MKVKINIESIAIFIFVITATLLNPLFNNAFVQYIDEMFMIFAAVQIFAKYQRIKKSKRKYQLFKITVICILLIVLFGIISNLNSSLVGWLPALIDVIGVIKSPIVFIYVSCICSEHVKEKTAKALVVVAKVYIPIVFVFGIVNLVTDIGMSYDIRYGLRTYEFIYRNPAALNEAILCFLGVIYKEVKSKQMLFTYSAFALISVLLTFRGAAFGVIAVFIYLFVVMKKGKQFKLKISQMIAGAGAVFLVGQKQFVEYLVKETPRSIMLRNSFVVLKRYFPLGSGFATYGSDQAFKNYSPLYVQFGYENVYWLSSRGGYAANDNFWPMVIGQFGIVGVFSYVGLIIAQLRFIADNRVEKNEKLIQLVLFVLLLVSSLGNAIFTSVSGMLIYVFIGLLEKT